MRLLKAQYGLEGLGAAIQLLQMIYHEGYYIEWSSETRQLFCAENSIDEARLNVILEFCIGHGLFDGDLFRKYSVLTSPAIQRQWLRICIDARRRSTAINPQLNLCTDTSDESDVQESGNIRGKSGNIPEKSVNITQDSGNIRKLEGEIKEKKIKEKKNTPPEACWTPQTAKEITGLIESLAEEKRAFLNGPPDAKEPISIRFKKLINKSRSS
jgi:hypothetical protein